MRTVTNSQLLDKMEEMDKRIARLEDTMNKGRGAVHLLAWLGGIAAVVGSYLFTK